MINLLKEFKRKRCASFALLAIVTLLVAAACAQQGGSWAESADTAWYENDKEASSYTLSTPEELAGLAVIVGSGDAEGAKNNFKGKTIILAKDINLSGKIWTPIGHSSGMFSGTFDGKGHTISGLGVVTPLQEGWSRDYGLFGYLNGAAAVKNFILKGDIVASGDKYSRIGTIAGYLEYANNNPIIENCSFIGSLKGMNGVFNGGIAGYNYGGIIRNCSVSADITADETGAQSMNKTTIGGIIGYNSGSSLIENSSFAGSIKYTDGISSMRVGGITGDNFSAACIIQNCVVSADINVSGGVGGHDSDQWYNCAGGVAGYNTGLVNNTAVTGSVKLHAEDDKYNVTAGGIVGVNAASTSAHAENSSISCKVSASSLLPEKAFAGSLVGRNNFNSYSPTVNRGKVINNRWVKGDGAPELLAGNWNEISGDILGPDAIISNDAVEAESKLPAAAVLTAPLIRLVENKSFTLAATVYPTAAYNKEDVTFAWNASDNTVISVAGEGASALVKALSVGFAKVNLTCGNLLGGENTYMPVTGAAVYRVQMEGLELSPKAISLDATGASAGITATILPDTDTPSYPVLKWTYEVVSGDNASADDIILSFGENSLQAKVTLKNHIEGAVYRVTASSVDDSSFTDSVLVTATAAKPSGGGSSGGCNAGFAALALLLPCALLFRKKG